jgi:hypothetical protein
MRTVTVRACLFTAFSFAAAFLWPFKPDLIPFMPFTPVVWFSCIGMVALSVSRFYGVRHAVPAPELYIFLYTIVLVLFINHVPYQVRTVDLRLLSFDYSFGYAGMIVGKWYRRSAVFGAILGLTYNSLMLAITAVYLALHGTPLRRRFVVAVVLSGTIILPLYLICPGAGPRNFLGPGFPWWVPDLSGPLASVAMPPMYPAPSAINAMPSGHFAWTLLLFWFARRYSSKGAQIAAGIYAALTFLATLGTGEHYVVDLILSFPFAACIWALAHRQWRLSALGSAVVLGWLVVLREGWALAAPPLVVWLLTGITVGALSRYLVGSNLPAAAAADADPPAPRVRSAPELHNSYT